VLKVSDLRQVGRGLADKTIGLFVEATGTIAGNERLKESGRDRQEAGSQRLQAVEEEDKATSRAAEARTQESRQKSYQPPERRSPSRWDSQSSAASAVAERAKGAVKKGVGVATGNEELEAEADAQREKARAQGQAAKHEAKADIHEAKADAALRSSEAARR
jgi:uncharacterized protein YjbJ (UPF0337 family)